MRVSVIVPSFNQGRFLEKSLESIFLQKGSFELECIVMDGGSSDSSVEIIRRFERRAPEANISFQWRSEKDGGQAAALNEGLARSSGEIVAYLNSDDLYSPGAIAEAVACFEREPHRAWVTGLSRIIDAEGNEIQKGVSAYRNLWLRSYSYRRLCMLNFIVQPTTFWRRSSAGTFDVSLRYTMDYDYWLRLGRVGAPALVPRETASFRIHDESKGGASYRAQFREDYETVCRYTGDRLIRAFHRLHNALVVTAYRFLK